MAFYVHKDMKANPSVSHPTKNHFEIGEWLAAEAKETRGESWLHYSGGSKETEPARDGLRLITEAAVWEPEVLCQRAGVLTIPTQAEANEPFLCFLFYLGLQQFV